MANSQRKALSDHRRRLRRKGIVRVEVQVLKADAPLVREVAKALSDPQRESEMRSLLRGQMDAGEVRSFKAFLAAAPLEGIELDRPRDTGRNIPL